MKTVIIGGSATGMGVAAKLKRLDKSHEIIVIQEHPYVSLGACGLPYFIGDNFQDSNIMIARTVEEFEESGVSIINNTKCERIDFKSKRIFLSNSKSISYDNLVIAMGSSPIIPTIKNFENENIFKLNSKQDAEQIKEIIKRKKKLTVVGSGLIGLELIENIRESSNIKINIIEKAQRPLQNLFEKDFTDLIENKMKEKNINFISEKEVIEFVVDPKTNELKYVKLEDGCLIETDIAILSIGVKPSTSFLKDSEIKLSPNGSIVVNEYCETNIKNVYSGGDCCQTTSFLLNQPANYYLATIANKQSKIIANNVHKKQSQKFYGALGTTIVRFFDLEFSRSGESLKTIKDLNIETKSVLIKDKDTTNYVNGQKNIWLKMYVDVKTKEILNVQFFGFNKSILRIYGVIDMMWNRIKVDEKLEQIDLPYSPPFSRTTDIIHIAISKLI